MNISTYQNGSSNSIEVHWDVLAFDLTDFVYILYLQVLNIFYNEVYF